MTDDKLKQQRKRQLIVWLIEVGILAVVVTTVGVIAMERMIGARLHNEREAVRRVQAVRIALEVYRQRTGVYPTFLYGGDAMSTFTTLESTLDDGPHPGYNGDPAGTLDDNDALLTSGILKAYPLNPFAEPQLFELYKETEKFEKGEAGQLPLTGGGPLITVPDWNVVQYDPQELLEAPRRQRLGPWKRAGQDQLADSAEGPYPSDVVPRVPAGPEGLRMFDVSEGQRHAPWPVYRYSEVSGFTYAPPEGADAEPTAFNEPLKGPGSYVQRNFDIHPFPHLPGNFYYCPLFGKQDADQPLYKRQAVGYKLCVYGDPFRAVSRHDKLGRFATDVYDLNGDFDEDIFERDYYSESRGRWVSYGGPDGRPDGVREVFEASPELLGDLKLLEEIKDGDLYELFGEGIIDDLITAAGE